MFPFISRHSATILLRDLMRSTTYLFPGEPVFEPSPAPAALQLLTPREAAKFLAVCEKTLFNLADRGEIPVVRIGRSVRYDPRDLSHFIEKSKGIGGIVASPAK